MSLPIDFFFDLFQKAMRCDEDRERERERERGRDRKVYYRGNRIINDMHMYLGFYNCNLIGYRLFI